MERLDSIKQKIEDCAQQLDLKGFESNVEELLNESDDKKASLILSEILMNRYTTNKSDSTAKLMEIVIRKNPELAMVNFPDNYLFRVAILKRSWELYECYLEEAIYPYLKNKSEDKIFKCYMALYTVVEKDIDIIFAKLKKQVLGIDFNGIFSNYNGDDSISLIHYNDFITMNNTVENFNSILGRKEIFKDLEKKLEE